MSETLKKLDDAKILFQQAKDSTDDPWKVRANLSSCVESLRSVTWIMKSEYAHVSGFKEWYSIKQEEMNGDEICKQFKNLRTDSTKRKSIINKAKIIIRINPKPQAVGKKTITKIKNIDGKIVVETPSTHESNTKIKYSFDGNDNDAIELTSLYLDKMEKLVGECMAQFNRL